MKILRDLIVLVLIFGGIWAASAFFFSQQEFSKMDVLDNERKQQLARHLDDQIKRTHAIYKNELVDSAMDVIADRLLLHSGDTLEYDITVLASDEINAFATLDGRIYLFTGLLKNCENPEMLAAVLAHEMGHIKHEHLVERLTKELGLTLLLSILTGGDPIMISELGKTSLQMHFNRDQEREADEYSHNILLKSKIDPVRFAQFMMISKRENKENLPLGFLSTHPDSEERILTSTSYEKPEGFFEEPYNLNWKSVVDTLNAEN